MKPFPLLPVTYGQLHRDFAREYADMLSRIEEDEWNSVFKDLHHKWKFFARIGGFAGDTKQLEPDEELESWMFHLERVAGLEKDAPGFAARAALDERVNYLVRSECVAFMTEGAPDVEKYYPKDEEGNVGLAVRDVVMMGTGVALRIEAGTSAELKSRVELGDRWPALIGGEFSEHPTCCKVVQRRGEESWEAEQWEIHNHGLKFPCRSVIRDHSNAASRTVLSVNPGDGGAALLADVHGPNVALFDNIPRSFDYNPLIIEPDHILRVKPLAMGLGKLLARLRQEGQPMELAPDLAAAMREATGGFDPARRIFCLGVLDLGATAISQRITGSRGESR